MGLDVYLRKCADLAAAKEAERAFERETDGLWLDGVAESVREEKLAAAAAKYGTDKWGSRDDKTDVSHDSAVDPEHYFKVGYFRSSYNGSGIENVMRKAGCSGLYDIFAVDRDHEYEIVPDWEASLARCDKAIVQYESFLRTTQGQYECIELRPMHEYGVSNEKEALDLFAKELESRREGVFNSYSNREGEFFLDGLTVRAAITKTYKRETSNPILALINRPTVFLVCDREKTDKEDWHLTALRIVRETIEYVLQQPDCEQFYLAWSA